MTRHSRNFILKCFLVILSYFLVFALFETEVSLHSPAGLKHFTLLPQFLQWWLTACLAPMFALLYKC